MDQLIQASLSHTHYWYGVSMSKVPAPCMVYGHTPIARVWINRVKGCQPCSWSAEQRKLIFPCPRSRLRIWPRETGSAVPSRVSLLISILRLNLVYIHLILLTCYAALLRYYCILDKSVYRTCCTLSGSSRMACTSFLARTMVSSRVSGC